jgi:hypothetical protein
MYERLITDKDLGHVLRRLYILGRDRPVRLQSGRSTELALLLELSWSGAPRKFLELELSWSEKMSDGYYELRFFLLHLRSLQRKLSVIN